MAAMLWSLKEKCDWLLDGVRLLFSWSPAASPSSCSICSQVREDVEKLHRMVKRIRALLSDAEEREIREDRIKLWLDELRDVAYDAEDLIEDLEYESLRCQPTVWAGEGEGEHPPFPAARGDARILGTDKDQVIATQIKVINARFDEIWNERVRLELREEDGQRIGASRLQEPAGNDRETGCLVDERRVHGRRDDRRRVIDLLLSDDIGGPDVRVVSIVGMGGVGKTTLAQLVFNDGRVAGRFGTRLWVCVSDTFDVIKLTRSILQQLLGRSFGLQQEFGCLQERLCRELQKKMFLLVFDDVWNENPDHWDALWVSLTGGAKGSRILITTRSEKASKASRASNMYPLGCLSDKDCWSLFQQQAFCSSSSGDCSAVLVPVGQEIVRRCQGLPLTVKLLAGLLFCEFNLDTWLDVLASDLWELQGGQNRILPSLKLSYYHLPSHVKPCFAYCAVFPKGYKFDMGELIYLWMAQGFIRPTAKRPMEAVARECFEDLLQRSFFQWSGDGHFEMHSLIHDLALAIRGGECSRLEADGRLSNTSRRPRHLWLEHRAADRAMLPSSCGPTDGFPPWLRTFYLIKGSWAFCSADCVLSLRYLRTHDAFQSIKYLRALSLCGWEVDALPDSLADLKHLRYLSIHRMVNLIRLPETLGNLLNLQTLEILDAFDLQELPNSLSSLLRLRHLILDLPRHSYRLRMMPCGIGGLTDLQALSAFVVGAGSGAAGIEELTKLDHLRGKLVIKVRSLTNWTNGSGGRKGKQPILKNKRNLESLVLEFDDEGSTGWDESPSASMQQRAEEFIEIVQPHTNIKELTVDGYMGSSFPKWMAYPSYCRLESIHLHSCTKCRHLPALGQLPSLKHLQVRFMDELRSVDRELLGDGMMAADGGASPFPALEQLHLSSLHECEGLLVGAEEGGAFPRLDLLKIEDCHKLRCIKLRHLTSLRELDVARCHKLTALDSGGRMHIPGIHTMRLLCCRRLNFPRQRQWLSSSLRRFEVTGSPLLEEWARRHLNN